MADIKPNYQLTIRNCNYHWPYILTWDDYVDESRLVLWQRLGNIKMETSKETKLSQLRATFFNS